MNGAVLIGLVPGEEGYKIGMSINGQKMTTIGLDQALSVAETLTTLLDGLGIFAEEEDADEGDAGRVH
jgi:formate-dependent phosphoribosylglycinamide formyltransferase (GAR transformylase)